MTDPAGNPVESQVLPFFRGGRGQDGNALLSSADSGAIRSGSDGQHPYMLVLPVEMPPLGFQVLHVARGSSRSSTSSSGSAEDGGQPRFSRYDVFDENESRGVGVSFPWGRSGTPPKKDNDAVAAAAAVDREGKEGQEYDSTGDDRDDNLPNTVNRHVSVGIQKDSDNADNKIDDGNGGGGGGSGGRLDGTAAAAASQRQRRLSLLSSKNARQTREVAGADADAAGDAADFSISNGLVTLTFDGATGRLSTVETHGGEDAATGEPVTLNVDQGWFFYSTFDGGSSNGGGKRPTESGVPGGRDSPNVLGTLAAAEASRLHAELPERVGASAGQEGGAYIFRPERSDGGARPVGLMEEEGGGGGLSVKKWWVEEGQLVSEVHQVSL